MADIQVDYALSAHTLDNGLRVAINYDPHAPGEAINMWYQVGSADELDGATGFAHLFEHLMFTGSAQVAASEHLSIIESVGGNCNATTSFDRTNFYETVPPQALDLALWLEGDRMGSLQISDETFETQREVVKEEKRQRYDNVPYGDMQALLVELNFPAAHPYGHLPIGSMADLDDAQPHDARDFFSRWYRPNNVFLTLSGSVPVEKALASVTRYLGNLESTPLQRQPVSPLAQHTGVPRMQVSRAVPSSMVHLCWRTPPLASPEHHIVEQALAVLASGQSSRMPDKLVRKSQIADAVGSGDFGLSRGTSVAALTARIAPGHSTQEVTDAMLSQLDRFLAEGPTDAELSRINAGFDRSWLSQLSSIDARADEISGFGSLLGDPGEINRLMNRVHAITAEQIVESARRWLAPEHRAELIYCAEEK